MICQYSHMRIDDLREAEDNSTRSCSPARCSLRTEKPIEMITSNDDVVPVFLVVWQPTAAYVKQGFQPNSSLPPLSFCQYACSCLGISIVFVNQRGNGPASFPTFPKCVEPFFGVGPTP